MATLSAGTKVGIGDAATPEVFNNIPGLTTLSTPESTTSSVDTTTIASVAKEYISGLPDNGSLSLEGFWDSGNTYHVALRTAHVAQTAANFLMVFSDSPATKVLFTATPETFVITSEPDAAITFSMGLKVSGALDWTTTSTIT